MISEASRRKRAVWVRAGRGVLRRWVVRNEASQVGEGVRCLVVVSWREIWEDRVGCVIALLMVDGEHYKSLWHVTTYCDEINYFLSGPRVFLEDDYVRPVAA